jgi:hypothetical protein
MADPHALVLPPATERPRRRGGAWLVVLVVVVVLVAAAAVAAEWLARGIVQGGVRQVIVSQLGLASSQQVDVEVGGLVIPQLISGRLDDLTVSAPDVTMGPITGDVVVNVTGMPIRADSPATGGTAVVRLDEQELRSLLAVADGFPADAVGIAAPDVTLSTELQVFGAGVPIGVALQPSAAEGDLVLTPQSITLGGAEISADDLRSRLGGLVDPLVRQWDICIARFLPSALTLTSVAVEGPQVVAGFDIDGAVVVDPALRENGTCA